MCIPQTGLMQTYIILVRKTGQKELGDEVVGQCVCSKVQFEALRVESPRVDHAASAVDLKK